MTRFRLYLASSRQQRRIIRDLVESLDLAVQERIAAEQKARREELRANDWEARWCDATFDTLKPRLRSEKSFVGEVPHCAGRSDVAHKRTAMWSDISGKWICPVCGEIDRLIPAPRSER